MVEVKAFRTFFLSSSLMSEAISSVNQELFVYLTTLKNTPPNHAHIQNLVNRSAENLDMLYQMASPKYGNFPLALTVLHVAAVLGDFYTVGILLNSRKVSINASAEYLHENRRFMLNHTAYDYAKYLLKATKNPLYKKVLQILDRFEPLSVVKNPKELSYIRQRLNPVLKHRITRNINVTSRASPSPSRIYNLFRNSPNSSSSDTNRSQRRLNPNPRQIRTFIQQNLQRRRSPILTQSHPLIPQTLKTLPRTPSSAPLLSQRVSQNIPRQNRSPSRRHFKVDPRRPSVPPTHRSSKKSPTIPTPTSKINLSQPKQVAPIKKAAVQASIQARSAQTKQAPKAQAKATQSRRSIQKPTIRRSSPKVSRKK